MPGARSTALLGAALLLAAALFDSPTLYVPGAALLALALGAVAWVELAARGLRLSREPGPATGIEGDPYPLGVAIERSAGGGIGRWLPLPGGELLDPALERPLPLPPGSAPRLRSELRLGRRGRRTLAPTSLVLRDPLGLHSRELRSGGESEVLVLPRTEPVLVAGAVAAPGRGWGAAERGEGEGSERDGGSRPASSPEVDGLRPHEDGVPASRIHWPTAARTGELFDRRLVTGSQSSHVVVLDVSRPSDEAVLDRAVRAAGSVCLQLAPSGGCALHLPGRSRPLPIDPRLAGWPQAHAALALVEAGDGEVAPQPGHRGLAVLVSSALDPPPADELAAIGRLASHLVLPFELDGRRPALEVAGCFGYRLGGAAAAAAPLETAA